MAQSEMTKDKAREVLALTRAGFITQRQAIVGNPKLTTQQRDWLLRTVDEQIAALGVACIELAKRAKSNRDSYAPIVLLESKEPVPYCKEEQL